ncbi:MAG: formate dehydrogenase accessory protein FdhE, partial [Burkholderiales bacterium]|nr:formate dehydrogenase accessory protein FdhE [Burkholderiales bacterium]
MASSILQPGQLEAPAGEIPFLRLPARTSFFKDRAERFRQLARDHKMGDFLAFMARIADAQHAALQHFPPVTLPDADQLGLCRQHGMPPLPAQGWKRDPAWRQALADIVDAVSSDALQPTQDALARLRQMDADTLEKLADAVLSGHVQETDLGVAPFAAAALQTYWVHMSTSLGKGVFGRTDPANLCPVCAAAPVTSLVRIGPEHGLRYLHCSLCASEWHMVRTKCSNCESTKNISYYIIEGDKGAVKAEACEECGSYLKILYLDKDPYLEPTADDLASLALDILMDERGVQRSGPNL